MGNRLLSSLIANLRVLPNSRLRIVRDFADKPSKCPSQPSLYRAPISVSRPLSLPDRKTSSEKGGMFQASRDA
jgi:hypothetical protein